MRDNQATSETQTGSETMSEKTQGSKYKAGRDAKETSALIRKEIRVMFPAKAGYKFSVKLERYSMGRSITIEVKAAPSLSILNPEYAKAYVAKPYDNISAVDFGGRYTRGAASLKISLERILSKYNRTDIDSQTDYYNVDFSPSVEFDSDLIESEWKKFEAARRAEA
jgi:hypothetical protein